MPKRLQFVVEQWVLFMVRRQTWQAQRFKFFESARHFRIESNRDGQFECESNLEASQVSSIYGKHFHIAVHTMNINLFSQIEEFVSICRDKTFYRVDLPSGLDAGKEITLDVETSYSHSMHAYPTHITQSERQYVRFIGNVYFYTPYHTQTLSTVVLCATSSIESYTKEKPVSTSEKTITYGPYEDVEPFKEVTRICMMWSVISVAILLHLWLNQWTTQLIKTVLCLHEVVAVSSGGLGKPSF